MFFYVRIYKCTIAVVYSRYVAMSVPILLLKTVVTHDYAGLFFTWRFLAMLVVSFSSPFFSKKTKCATPSQSMLPEFPFAIIASVYAIANLQKLHPKHVPSPASPSIFSSSFARLSTTPSIPLPTITLKNVWNSITSFCNFNSSPTAFVVSRSVIAPWVSRMEKAEKLENEVV